MLAFAVADSCAELVSESHSFFAYISYNTEMGIFDDAVHQGGDTVLLAILSELG